MHFISANIEANQSINTSFGFQANSSSHQSDLWPPHVQGLGLVWTPQKPSSPPTSSLCSQPNHGAQESLQFLYCLIWSSEFNLNFRAIPVDKKRPMSALARLWKTLEVSQRKEERAKQAPILSPCRLVVFPKHYYISNTTPLRLFHETDMPIDSLQRDVSTLTETTKRDISSLQFGHFSYFFHLYIQGDFFNWASPEFAKCWPVSNWFKKKC